MNVITRALGGRRLSPVGLGVVFVVVSLVAGAALFQKNRIMTAVQPGETITIQFARDYQLRQFVSSAKVAGVPVGTVSAVDRVADGVTEVRVKIAKDVPRKLGTAPSAAIRPTTLLGGNYYIDLTPGGTRGTFSGTIPVERTALPVELDKVSSALQPDAREGLRSTVRDLNGVLEQGGSDALRELVETAPDTLRPAADVFDGMRGTQPGKDLPTVVRGFESTARVLSRHQGQLDGIARDLAGTASVLANRGSDMSDALAGLPATLASTDRGLERLDTTLAKLAATADVARPVVAELGTVITNLDPVLVKAKPIVRDARTVLAEARPLVDALVPASTRLTSVFDDVRGPVMKRVNGPIMDTVNSPYQGAGRYAGSGSDRPLYQELAYLATNADRATMVDKNGSMISFLAGGGPGTVAGLPISLEQLFRQLAGQQEDGQ